MEKIHASIQETVSQFQLKFPKVAMPLRVMLTGVAQSPSIDAVMHLMGHELVLDRMGVYCKM